MTRPGLVMVADRVMEFVIAAKEPQYTQQIRDGVTGGSVAILCALDFLVTDGYLTRRWTGNRRYYVPTGRATDYRPTIAAPSPVCRPRSLMAADVPRPSGVAG